MSHFMLTYGPWAAAALVAVAVANLIRAALRSDRRKPRYRLHELTDLSRLDVDGLIERDQHGEGRQ